jgi:ABC-type antimicrobial peptide transport system permease subunit
MVKHYLRIALRSFSKDRTSGLINVIGLALGMTATLFIGLWVSNELSYDRYHDHVERIYLINNHIKISDSETWHWSSSPYRLGGIVGERLADVEAVTMQQAWGGEQRLRYKNEVLTVEHCTFVDSMWFKVFKYNFVSGNPDDFFKNPASIVLSESEAYRIFGNNDPIGQVMRYKDQDCVVRGVLQDPPLNSSFKYDLLFPISLRQLDPNERRNDSQWGNFSYHTFLRLRPDADPKKVGKLTTQILRKEKNDSTTISTLHPLTELRFQQGTDDAFQHTDKGTIQIFSIIGLMILLIAGINYVNLALARTGKRGKEIGVQKVMGAGKGQIFGQFMLESLLMCGGALILTFVFARLALPYFNALTGEKFVLNFLDYQFWGIAAGVLGVSILLTGIYPSLLLSSFQAVNIMKGSALLGKHKTGLWKGLSVLQFAVAVALIVATIVIASQLHYIRSKNLGFDRDYVFKADLPFDFGLDTLNAPVIQSMISELSRESSINGVSLASVHSIVKYDNSSSGGYVWEGRVGNENPTFSPMTVDHNFHKVFGLKLKAGRWFRENDIADRSNFILNETTVKMLKLKEPVLGQKFEGNGRKGQIIGVVKDFHTMSLHDPIRPVVLTTDKDWMFNLYFKTSGAQAEKAVAAVKKAWTARIHGPTHVFKYEFVDDQFNEAYKKDQQTGMLFNAFAGVAILISCMGLFALAAFSAERRVKEIGVRKVLGASVANLTALLSRDFLVLVLIGFVIATPLAWYLMNQWLENFAFRIEIQWWYFALAGILTLALAMLTVGYQTIRAALANPVSALKNE